MQAKYVFVKSFYISSTLIPDIKSAAESYKTVLKSLDLDMAFIFKLHEVCIEFNEMFDNQHSSVSDSKICTI